MITTSRASGRLAFATCFGVLLSTAGCSFSGIENAARDLPGIGNLGVIGSDALSEEPALTNVDLVRAPEIFAASGVAVWDGRRTARGVWVAHPRVNGTLPVRIVHNGSGAEVDGRAYRARGRSDGDVLAVSSDTAEALRLPAGQQQRISIFAVRPKDGPAQAQAPQTSAEAAARAEVGNRIARLDHPALLQFVAAAMRGMGYATAFDAGRGLNGRDAIRAVSVQGSGDMPAIHVDVRASSDGAMGPEDVGAFKSGLSGTGQIGVLVSVRGFADGPDRALLAGGNHVEMVDLDTLVDIWVTNYETMAEADRSLLRLRPVYVLADG